MPPSVYVVLADGFEEIEAVTPIDILRRAGLNVVTIGLNGQKTIGSHGISISCDKTLASVANTTPDILVFPGGMPGSKNLGESAELKQMAIRVAEQNGILAAICAASAFTFAAWGLLAGKNATCYPGCEQMFPINVTHQNMPVVKDGRIVTAAGPGSAADFAFAILEMLGKFDSIDKLRVQMLYE